MHHAPITPEIAEKMVEAIDHADTAFCILELCPLQREARNSLITAWRHIVDVMKLLSPDASAYDIGLQIKRAAAHGLLGGAASESVSADS